MESGLQRLRVLVVEDNPGDILLIQEAFRDCGVDCELVIAEDIARAIRAAQQARFDLVVSDMSVGGNESARFFEWMRFQNAQKSTPIIVVSGMSDPGRAYRAGANVVIAKSPDVDQFFGKIREMMHFWGHVAELPFEE